MSAENVEIVGRVHGRADRRVAATVLTLFDAEVGLDACRVRVRVVGVWFSSLDHALEAAGVAE